MDRIFFNRNTVPFVCRVIACLGIITHRWVIARTIIFSSQIEKIRSQHIGTTQNLKLVADAIKIIIVQAITIAIKSIVRKNTASIVRNCSLGVKVTRGCIYASRARNKVT